MRVLIYFLGVMMLVSTVEGITVLVTGANRGLGYEFAKQYRAMGVDVIGTARDPADAEELKAMGVRVEALDVADPVSISALAQTLKGVPIDVLINNAGVFLDRNDTVETIKAEDLATTFAVNASGPLLVTQALLPNLRQGQKKQVVNITSQLGSIANNSGGMYAYRASKAALNQLSKTMSLELQDVTVVALHPGWVRTDMGGSMATYSPEQSVKGMIDVIKKLNRNSTGRFLDLNGKALPW